MSAGAGPPPSGPDQTRARRLLDAGATLVDELDVVGAVRLYREAVRADPLSYAAHFEYIHYAAGWIGARSEIRRDYARLADERPEPFFECLAIYAESPMGYPQAARGPLLELERRHGASPCTAVGIAEGSALRPARVWRERQASFWRAAVEQAPDLAANWGGYAVALADADRFAEAREAARRGLAHARGAGERVLLHQTLASIHERSGDDAAAAVLRRAVAAAVERDGRRGVRYAFSLHRRPSTPADNEHAFRERARLARGAAGAWPAEWAALLNLGTLLSDGGRPREGLAPLDRSVYLADSAARPLLGLIAYRQRGRALSKMGRLAAAERDLRRAIDLGEAIDEPYHLAEAYHNLAHVHESAGRLAEAEEAASRFVALTRPMLHAQPRMMSLHDAGVIRWKAGWHAAANAAFAEMVRVVDAQESNHYWAGEFLERVGDYRGALHYYRAGAELDRHERSLNLGGLVRVYLALGMADSAFAAARVHDAAISNQLDVPMLPRILAERGRTDEAARVARGWARRRLESGSVQGATLATLELAEILLAGGRAREASTEADRAAVLARRVNLTEELIAAERLGGLARVRLGEAAAGLALLRRAVARAEAHPTTGALLDARLALGDGLATGGSREALAAYDAAARVVERVSGGLDLDTDRARYRERHLAPFDRAIGLLLDASSPADHDLLLDWSRRRKAAVLSLFGDPAAGGALDARSAPSARRSGATRRLQAALAADEAFVDYLLLDERSAAVVVTRGHVAVVPLPLPSDSLRALALRLRAPLTVTYDGRVDLARAGFELELAHRLYLAALAPLLPHLMGVDRLTIAPDGPLHLVPFEALPFETPRAGDYPGARYVIDRWEIAFVPSVEFAGRPRARVDPSEPLLLVARDVPGGAREIEAILDAWRPGDVERLTGAAATEEALAARAPGRAVVHFAAHARADDRDPAASHLRLAPGSGSDGFLHAGEIAALDLEARVVVLSGCETVSGPVFAGEGRMGLARAFLARGARVVVATDWPVGEAAAEVAAGFYRRLAGGAAPAAALRGAKLDLRRDPATAHPFHWAGFLILTG